jgi:enoyl-CoA hydratase
VPLIVIEHPADSVILVRLNRPDQRNALSFQMREELSQSFRKINDDAAVRSVVIAGNSRHFAVGADIRELDSVDPIDLLKRDTASLWTSIRACSKPVIAAVEGLALGGGCELALHADIIIAGDQAKFGLPEARIGILPGGGGTQRLPRAVGKYKAMLMLLSGELISAGDADAWGLVSRVVSSANTEREALDLALRLASLPPLALSSIKEVVNAGLDAPLDTGLRLEQRAVQVLFASADMREGIQAFLEKRVGRFEGR